MSTVDTISSMLETYGLSETTTTSSSDTLDRDAFLNLLTTQMQYQDPLEPTSNEDFLAQMAQFSALEQMQNLNTSFSLQQGYALVGKEVIGLDSTDSSEYVEGTVDAVTLKSGEVYLTIGDVEVALSDVQAVVNDTTQSDSLTEALDEINASLTSINERLDSLASTTESTTDSDETE